MIRRAIMRGRDLPARHQGALLSLFWRDRDAIFHDLKISGGGLDALGFLLDMDFALAFDDDVLVCACGLQSHGMYSCVGPMVTREAYRNKWLMRDLLRYAFSDGLPELLARGLRGTFRATVRLDDGPVLGLLESAGFRHAEPGTDMAGPGMAEMVLMT